MVRARFGFILGILALVTAVPGVAPARSQTHRIRIISNLFFPSTIRVSPGDTIVWRADAPGHTVTAQDMRFNYPPGTSLMKEGDEFRFVFPLDETVNFYCRVHGQSGGPKPGSDNMLGKIIVGTGGNRPAPPPGAPQVRNVPSQFPTIAAALIGIPPDSTVRVAPGRYSTPVTTTSAAGASVTVTVDGVTIEGTGIRPDETILDGLSDRPTGIAVAAYNVTIRNLRVTRHLTEGIVARSVEGLQIENVVTDNNGAFGILAVDTSGILLTSVRAADARFAAIMIRQCESCGAVLSSVTVEDSLYGIAIDAASGVLITDSLAQANGTGIVVRSTKGEFDLLASTVTITRSRIVSNTRDAAPSGLLDFPVRSGIWISGAHDVEIQGNTIVGHDYGVLIAGGEGIGAVQVSVLGNVIDASAKADVGFDGAGVNVCFAGNKKANGDASSSRPAQASLLYDCSLPATVGVLEPTVIADFVGYALATQE